MIAKESIKKYNKRDIGGILILSILGSLTLFGATKILPVQYTYMSTMIIISCISILSAMIVKKMGATGLTFILIGIITFSLNDLGIIGFKKVLMYSITGVIYEILFLIAKIEVKKIPLDAFVSTVISMMTMPWSIALIIAPHALQAMTIQIINLTITSLVASIIGCIGGICIWLRIRTTKTILKFEYRI